MSDIKKDKTYWCSIIADYLESGMKQAAYCTHHGIAYATFKRWRYLLKDEFPIIKKTVSTDHQPKQQPIFVPVNIVPEQLPHQQKPSPSTVNSKLPSMQLHFRNQITLELPAGLDKAMLHALFSALGVLTC